MIRCQRLFWGLEEDIQSALTTFEISKNDIINRYDVVLGCELMYYVTDIPVLVSTVMSLVDSSNGLFIHAHLFRRYGQEEELITSLASYGWMTCEIPIEDFVSAEELSYHAEWYYIRVLISGTVERIREIMQRHRKWKVFTPNSNQIDEGEEQTTLDDAGQD